MKKSMLCGIALMAIAGCGADANEDADISRLDGLWAADESAGLDCAYGLEFGPGDAFSSLFICSLQSGGYGAQVSNGTFVDYGDSIRVWFEESSCSQEVNSLDVDYVVNDDALTLRFSDTAARVYTRADGDGDATGSVTIGCFSVDGGFQTSPVRPL